MSSKLSYDVQKAILKSHSYVRGEKPHRVFGGRCIGHDKDHRGFGGIVAFPGYKDRSFFIVNPKTLKPEYAGAAPAQKR